MKVLIYSSVSAKAAKKATTVKVQKPDKKRHKKKKESYAINIYKVLRQVYPDTGTSVKAMSIMTSFVNDVFERIPSEASRLAHYNKTSTIVVKFKSEFVFFCQRSSRNTL